MASVSLSAASPQLASINHGAASRAAGFQKQLFQCALARKLRSQIQGLASTPAESDHRVKLCHNKPSARDCLNYRLVALAKTLMTSIISSFYAASRPSEVSGCQHQISINDENWSNRRGESRL